MKVALVYDRVNKWGGAERILLTLHKLFPKAPLYTAVYNPKTAPWASVFDVKTSFLQNLPYASSAHEWYPLLMPLAFESFSFDEYDVVISVTSEAAKGIITSPFTKHICYCLTPTRYLWSGYNQYFSNPVFRFLSHPAVSYLKTWDHIAAQRPDAYIAISQEVQKRIKKYYERDAICVYPGVTLPWEDKSTEHRSNDYFLVVSRLVAYKRIDLAIKACNMLSLPLKIIGIGSEEKKLRNMASKTVEFLGNLTEKEVLRYYRSCTALIFPGYEDLGLSVIEAQASGKPVIAFEGGGALETIVRGKTGVFFTQQTVNSLAEALKSFQKMQFSKNACLEQAKKFSEEKFKSNFFKVLTELTKESNYEI
ncbi:MAG: glycosyltransferase [Candidatus Levybacteria bacterium]|nr:glycosyltransferase [Candidatus Levybacteria bacterium]